MPVSLAAPLTPRSCIAVVPTTAAPPTAVSTQPVSGRDAASSSAATARGRDRVGPMLGDSVMVGPRRRPLSNPSRRVAPSIAEMDGPAPGGDQDHVEPKIEPGEVGPARQEGRGRVAHPALLEGPDR